MLEVVQVLVDRAGPQEMLAQLLKQLLETVVKAALEDLEALAQTQLIIPAGQAVLVVKAELEALQVEPQERRVKPVLLVNHGIPQTAQAGLAVLEVLDPEMLEMAALERSVNHMQVQVEVEVVQLEVMEELQQMHQA
jgi:hypothetical protein